MNKFRKVTGGMKRIFVVGDVHACLQELNVLLDHLIKTRSLSQEDQVIFIGDYIDRGPDSKGVIDRLIQLKKDFPRTIYLKGNHEDMLLSYLGFPGNNGEIYLYNGGIECLMSYNLNSIESASVVYKQLPEDHINFFLALESAVEIDDYIFVHAGLNPYRPLEKQKEDDLFWIRGDFIMSTHSFNKTILFGHTPYQEVLFDLPFKIGIDTGLVYGNKLSCVELVNGDIIQVERNQTEVRLSTFRERGIEPEKAR